MKKVQFDYYHGTEAEQYTFYRVPKILFTDEYFKCISCEAKILYGLMLDRMSLSIKNQWYDDENRVYIIFTIEEVKELIGCGSQKAIKLMKELDTENGIGLIEKKRLGMGKANVIYVRKFYMKEREECLYQKEKKAEFENIQNFENQNSGSLQDQYQSATALNNEEFGEQNVQKMGEDSHEFSSILTQNFENQNSGSMKIKNQEFRKSKIKNFENRKSESMKTENQEFRKSKGNNTDKNETNINDTKSIISYPDNRGEKKRDVVDVIELYRKIIRNNISYAYLVQDGFYKVEDVDELVELMVDVMMLPDNSMVRIGGMERPVEIVKSQFMKLTMEHIQYVISCLQKNTKKVGNIKSYLMTALYNAPMTMSHYYQAQVNHDVHGGGYQ